MVTATLRPRGPYSFRLSTRHGSDATRRVYDGVYTATIAGDGGLEQVRAWQRPDGAIRVRAASEAGVEHVRFVLGLEDDHSEFLRRFADDPLIGEATRRFRGLRPLRTATVAQALLRAVAGQLITSSRAREIERTVIRAATPQARRAARPADRGRPRPLLAGRARAARARRPPRRCARPPLPHARPRSAEGPSDRRGRPAARARARASGRGRSASSASRASAATSAGSPATSASSSWPRRSGDGESRRRRRTSCSRRTRSGPGSRACTCWRATAPDS